MLWGIGSETLCLWCAWSLKSSRKFRLGASDVQGVGFRRSDLRFALRVSGLGSCSFRSLGALAFESRVLIGSGRALSPKP